MSKNLKEDMVDLLTDKLKEGLSEMHGVKNANYNQKLLKEQAELVLKHFRRDDKGKWE